MENEIPDLIFIYPSFFSQEKIDVELNNVKNDNLKIIIHKNEANPIYASFDWIVPTAFGVYILKPYFEGFLSEAGKDHYTILKKFINSFLAKGKEFNFSVLAAEQSPEKLSKKYNNSFSVSIEIQTKNNRVIKILYDNSLSLEDWRSASNEILNIFENHYKNYPNDELTAMLKNFEDKPQRKLYITVDKFPQNYLLKDDTLMMVEFKNR